MYFRNIPIAIFRLTSLVPCAKVAMSRWFCGSGRGEAVIGKTEPKLEERTFAALRRKVQEAELLSPATELLLRNLRFSGRLSIVVQNGCILKSGYEEGYFTRRQEERMIP